MGLPPEPRRLDGGSVAEVPAFSMALRRCVLASSAGLGGHIAFRLAEAFPPRMLPHSLGLTVSTLPGDLHPRDCLTLKVKAQHLSFAAVHPALTDEVFLRS